MNLRQIIDALELIESPDLETGLVDIDLRKVTTTDTSALISIPSAKSLGIVGNEDELEGVVSVQELDGEIVVTARIQTD